MYVPGSRGREDHTSSTQNRENSVCVRYIYIYTKYLEFSMRGDWAVGTHQTQEEMKQRPGSYGGGGGTNSMSTRI